MSSFDSAMASGAQGPDPRANAAMAAAPSTPAKRTTAGGSSPKYFTRATRRELVGELGVTPTVSHEQLAAEVHRSSQQAHLDGVFFEHIANTLDMHAEALERLRAAVTKLTEDTKGMSDRVLANDAATKQVIDDHDIDLKEKLRLLEGTVTNQGNDTKTLREQTKVTAKKLDEHFSTLAVAARAAASTGVDAVALDARLVVMQTTIEASMRALEGNINELKGKAQELIRGVSLGAQNTENLNGSTVARLQLAEVELLRIKSVVESNLSLETSAILHSQTGRHPQPLGSPKWRHKRAMCMAC